MKNFTLENIENILDDIISDQKFKDLRFWNDFVIFVYNGDAGACKALD